MTTRTILGKEVYDAPRRQIAGADCWLSEDREFIIAARKLEQADARNLTGKIRRWRAEPVD